MVPSPDRNLPPVPTVAGVKRPAASLLPAFEPLSSSPALPRALKRFRDSSAEVGKYPTPVPTSSTLIPTSSPSAETVSRPCTRRQLNGSERAPLADVPMIELPGDGKPILMGRSSAACHHQFSSNRLISRVHVSAAFKAASLDTEQDRIEIHCSGWNGVKIRCSGSVLEINKDETFSSCHKGLDVIVDVQDSRVCLKWPATSDSGFTSGSSDEEGSPTPYPRSLQRHSTPTSPIRLRNRMVSPISPSPAARAVSMPSSPPNLLQPSGGPVVVYEDEPSSPEQDIPGSMKTSRSARKLSQPTRALAHPQESIPNEPQGFFDPDEENDPFIQSFGPTGANLLPRMASVTAHDSPGGSPRKESRPQPQPLGSCASPPQPRNRSNSFDAKTHVINQLAFSRLSSTPLSTIMSHFPVKAGKISGDVVRDVIAQTSCVGEVAREGKDAAGKALESEYYYIADEDEDEMRKEAVVKGLRKPGLRNCRKQHKQYFWRKPK